MTIKFGCSITRNHKLIDLRVTAEYEEGDLQLMLPDSCVITEVYRTHDRDNPIEITESERNYLIGVAIDEYYDDDDEFYEENYPEDQEDLLPFDPIRRPQGWREED